MKLPQVIPADLEKFLAIIQKELPLLLGDKIMGIYLYGSLSYGDWGENRSDVDIAIVIKEKLSPNDITKIDSWFSEKNLKKSRWHYRSEIDFIEYNKIKKIKQNTISTVRLAGSELKEKSEMEGVSLDVRNLYEQGIALFGPDPKKVFPIVTKDLLIKAIAENFYKFKSKAFEWVKIDLWNQQFVVTQFCRVLYTIQNNYQAVSKQGACKWAIKNVPAKLRPMVKKAYEKIDDFRGPKEKIIEDNLVDLIEYVESRLEK